MAKRIGRCTNYGLCDKADQRSGIEADEFDFVCPECGKSLRPLQKPPGKGPNWLLLGLIGLLATGAVAGLVAVLWPGDDKAGKPPVPPPPKAEYPSGPEPANPAPAVPNLAPAKCSPQPLLMPGKHTLYQRVLTRPGASLAGQPGAAGRDLLPLERYYVYERHQANGEEWLKVGGSLHCRTDGWLRAASTVPWEQQITVAFDNPAGRERVLLFENEGDLDRIVHAPRPAEEIRPILDAFAAHGRHPKIVAAEPKNFIDVAQRFYLLPILEFRETRNDQGLPLQLLRVHSITKTGDQPPPPGTQKAAVVFVIDSTISMKKYIDRTKQAVMDIIGQLRRSPGGNEIRFGLVAFRSSTQAVPKLDYLAKPFVDLGRLDSPSNGRDFEAGIDRIEEARVSSARFDEDAYAGLKLALEETNWEPFDSRQVVLITDAGALDADDSLSSTRQDAAAIRKLALDRGVYLYAIHLKTPAGQNDHARAEAQYRQLARTRNDLVPEPLYYPVKDTDDITDFGKKIECVAHSITHNIRSLGEPGGENKDEVERYCPLEDEVLRRMRRDADILGHALRLEYLGRTEEGKGAPPDFEGWISDRDIENPIRPNVEVRLLLSKNELSDLAERVREILDAARAGKSSAAEFYRSLSSLSAAVGRDPNLAKPERNRTIADLGLFGEYLDGLPYKSDVMSLDQETWEGWSASQQEEFIRSIENKLERYRYYDSNNALWQKLFPTDKEGDEVSLIPLDALP
jgi:serine/threonine-protein kinase PpkA